MNLLFAIKLLVVTSLWTGLGLVLIFASIHSGGILRVIGFLLTPSVIWASFASPDSPLYWICFAIGQLGYWYLALRAWHWLFKDSGSGTNAYALIRRVDDWFHRQRR